MISTLILDDEQHCIDRLLEVINSSKNNLNIVATCKSVDEAIKATKKLQPQLVLLDVEIQNKTGFDYLKQLEHFDFEVIFTTAFEDYAIQAIKFSALDYLLKPIDFNDFNISIEKLEKKLLKPDLQLQIQTLFHNLKSNSLQKQITIPSQNGFDVIKIADIIHCEASTSYTYIHTHDKKFMVSKSLKYYENLLQESHFFRVHNSHLINLNCIKKYTKGKGGYVTMTNNIKIDVSTRRKEEFLRLLTSN